MRDSASAAANKRGNSNKVLNWKGVIMVIFKGFAGSAAKGLGSTAAKAGAAAVLKSISVALAGGAGVVAVVAAAMIFSQLHDLGPASRNSENDKVE